MRLAPDYPIRTERLLLRPLTAGDTESLLRYRSIPDVCRYVPFEPMDAAMVAERLSGVWARTELTDADQSLTLGIELAGSGELVGDVVLFFESVEHRGGEIGWIVDPLHGGHGYVTEAAKALLDKAFSDLGLHRVTARIDARNDASVRLAERLGMRREAVFRENEWFKGEWTDEIRYALLESEWPPAAG